MSFFEYRVVKKAAGEKDSLHIHRNRKIQANISVFRFVDKDTKQHVVYAPSLEISGYGDSEEKAKEMMNESLKSYFDMLIKMTPKRLDSELSKLKWKKHPLENKVFSNIHVDKNGDLKNFNAVDDKVEKMMLVA